MGQAIVTECNSQIIVELTTTMKPYAVMLTKDVTDAEDLVQETIYRALGNKEKFSDGTNLKAWLFTIMKNIFINNYRRTIKRNTILNETTTSYYLNNSSETAKNAGESNLGMENIQAAIDNLSDDFRVPFLMHYDGFKYQEIAEDLALPIGTVKSRIFLARRELQRFLQT